MKREIKEYAVREAEFLETGRTLFFSKGYLTTSVNDIITSMGVAKGTFYHYFKSKEDLLDRIIARFMKDLISGVNDIIKNDRMGAVEKFNTAFMSIRNLKFENMELMIMLMRTLYNDDNILLRHKMFRETISRMTPLWAEIIEQGVREGVFNCDSPLETAELIVAMSAHLNESIVPMISLIKDNPEYVIMIKGKISAFEKAIERLIGGTGNGINIFNTAVFDTFVKRLLDDHE